MHLDQLQHLGEVIVRTRAKKNADSQAFTVRQWLPSVEDMDIRVNGTDVAPPDDARVSLLDLLRDHLHLTGTKVGCNQARAARARCSSTASG